MWKPLKYYSSFRPSSEAKKPSLKLLRNLRVKMSSKRVNNRFTKNKFKQKTRKFSQKQQNFIFLWETKIDILRKNPASTDAFQ